MMKSGKTPAKDFLVIDVRDDDYAGGNIKGARNYPSREFLLNVDKLVSETKNVPVMVFHCTLSQVRCNPKIYQETRQNIIDDAPDQDVFVLRNGFSDFQIKYKPTPSLPDPVSSMDSKDKFEKEAQVTTTPAVEYEGQTTSPAKYDRSKYDFTAEELATIEVDPAVAARVRRKLDLHLMPIIFCMYLFSALDRGNLGNAKTDGLNADLGLVGNQYNNILTVQSVTFATMAIFGGYFSKRLGAARMMPIYMVVWGTMAMLNSVCKNYSGALAVRYFLGTFEGFFGPTVPIYLTSFYTRGELARRLAVWYSAAAFSGAFSGLLAYGVFHIQSSRLGGWQILFLLEGGLTIVCGALAFVLLPAFPQRAKFLTEKEKETAVVRLLKDSSKMIDAPFKTSEFLEPAKDWKFYVLVVFALCYGTASSTATTFLPQLLARFEFSAVKTNLYTVAPNLVAVCYLFTIAFLSDYTRQRTLFLMLALATTMTGCIILASVPVTAIGVGYFACFLIQCGSHVPTVIFHSWHNNNDPSENGRAFRTYVKRQQFVFCMLIVLYSGCLTFAANAGSLISSNIFLDSWAPKYTKALIISACLQVLGITILACMRTYMMLQNRRRNREQGVNWASKDVPTAVLAEGPKHPSFRYVL
ncbi:major facilitator superfamily domain-containing protein [Schizophyllum commune]